MPVITVTHVSGLKCYLCFRFVPTLTGPTNHINPHPARWRCACRAYKRHQPTSCPWRCAYRAYIRHQPTSCPVALRLPGRQTASTHTPPGGATLTGPTNGIGTVGRIRRSRHPAYYRRSPASISTVSPAQSSGYNPFLTSRWNVEYGQSLTHPTSRYFTGLI